MNNFPERSRRQGIWTGSCQKKTAEAFESVASDRIIIAGLTIFPDTPLMKDVQSGEFQEATEGERVLELKEFLNNLNINTLIDATNASIITAILGKSRNRNRKCLTAFRLYMTAMANKDSGRPGNRSRPFNSFLSRWLRKTTKIATKRHVVSYRTGFVMRRNRYEKNGRRDAVLG